jgi:hypothetical protein
LAWQNNDISSSSLVQTAADYTKKKPPAEDVFKRRLILLICAAVLWGATVVYLGGFSRFSNVFGKGAEFHTAGDLEVLYSRSLKNVRTGPVDLHPTGWYTTVNGVVSGRYFFYNAEDLFIIVFMPGKYTQEKYLNLGLHGIVSGKTELASDVFFEGFIADVAAANEISHDTAAKRVSPYVISFTGASNGMAPVLFIAVSAALLAALVLFIIAGAALAGKKRPQV